MPRVISKVSWPSAFVSPSGVPWGFDFDARQRSAVRRDSRHHHGEGGRSNPPLLVTDENARRNERERGQ